MLDGGIVAVDGGWTPVVVDTLCVHGDTPDADRLARSVRAALESAGVVLRTFIADHTSLGGRMTVTTDLVAFGDRAWLITTEDLAGAHRLGAAIERAIADGAAPPGTAEATVGMSTVVVHLEPPSGGNDQPQRDDPRRR